MEENSVCFMCARCKQLVKLDSSFDSIDEQTVQNIIASSKAVNNTTHLANDDCSSHDDGANGQQSTNNVRIQYLY